MAANREMYQGFVQDSTLLRMHEMGVFDFIFGRVNPSPDEIYSLEEQLKAWETDWSTAVLGGLMVYHTISVLREIDEARDRMTDSELRRLSIVEAAVDRAVELDLHYGLGFEDPARRLDEAVSIPSLTNNDLRLDEQQYPVPL